MHKKSTAFSTLSYEVAFSKDPGILWEYKPFGSKNIVSFALPVLEINGEKVTFSLSEPIEDTPPVTLRNGVSEYVFKANVEGYTGLIFRACFRAAQNSPVLRFRYELIGTENQKTNKIFTKK
ncbi:MAG: hypothetical protein HC905_30165, partial [Bacteroidales bacterium]|nr:hypothetical protein [Bacteroidales bacterium]